MRRISRPVSEQGTELLTSAMETAIPNILKDLAHRAPLCEREPNVSE